MEYNDSKILIFVKNLPLFISNGEQPLILKSIRTIKGIQDIELYEGINLIELSLSEIIDFLIKKSLHDTKIEALGIDYYILGGKAINNIIKLKYLKKSFDFDIHVKKPEDIINISKYITDYCNSELNKSYNKMFRYQIYKKLLLLNLVDNDSNLKHYYFHNNLIFYGNRINRTKPANQISGLFIKLKLRKNLFKYNNIDIKYTNYLLNTDLNANDFDRIDVNNILYIPIADIDLDNVVTFGINVYNTSSSIYRNPFENINYADFSIILFNLLKCIVKVPNKIESNGKKLNNFIKSLYYNCNIYNEYNSLNKFNTMYRKIIKSLKKYKDVIIYDDCFPSRCQKLHQFIDDNKVSDLSRMTTYGSFIEKLVNKIINTEEFYLQNCQVLLGEGNVLEETNIFRDDVNKDFPLQIAVRILADLDQVNGSYFFLQYTDSLYKNLNTYCNYLNNNIPTDSLYPYEFNNTQFEYSIIGRDINFNNGIINYNDVITTMNNIYDLYHRNETLIPIRRVLKDNFYIYSSQLITNFTQMDSLVNRSFIDLSYIKVGDIIQISQYLSGTFNTEFDFSFFNSYSSSNRIFLKIKINKNNKNWIIIDKYSINSQESEILLKQNSIFFIEKIDYKVVNINGKKKEYKIITLEICDNNNFDLIRKKVLVSCGFNDFDNILKTPLFIKSLKYVYTTYFNKPYKESYCTHLAMEADMPITRINENGQRITELIYKYNHALAHTVRVACWIQLLYLQDRLYNELDTNTYDQKFLMKTCIASIFMISGRESEAGFSTDFTPAQLSQDCPEIMANPYERYLTQSANNFNNYINLLEIKELSLFNDEDKADYKYCLEHYYYIYNDEDIGGIPISDDSPIRKEKRKKIATYFSIAHNNDLIRCHDEAYVGTMLDENHPSYKKEIKINAQLMCDIMTNTGDRIYSTKIQHGEIKDQISNLPYIKTLTQKNYDKLLFYLCSTNPEYCITSVLNTTDEYFNQLIYDLEEYNFFKDRQQPNTFHLDTLITVNPDDKDDKDDKDDDEDDEDKDSINPSSKKSSIPSSKKSSMPSSKPTYKPIERFQFISSPKKVFIDDDNSNDVESINLQVNNSNLGSTYYIPSKSYSELTKKNSLFLINGIYFQNIYTSFNKSIDICNEQFIYKLRVGQVRIYEYEKEVYPQYFINIDTLPIEEDSKYLIGIVEDNTLKEIAKQIAKTATQHIKEKIDNKIYTNNPSVSTINPSVSTINIEGIKINTVYKSKYLKYKKKYLELKNKLNL